MSAKQFVIGLPALSRLSRADFLPAAANEAALAFVDAWPRWPGPALVIHGPEGSGKSHLAAIWRERAGPLVLAPEALAGAPARALLGDSRAVLIEDLDRAIAAAEPPLDAALFSLWTALAERQGHLLLTARLPPARWKVRLADLGSRLRGATAVTVAAPDEDLLAGLLLKLLNDRQVRIAPEVVRFLLPRIERSFGAVYRLAAALDRAALAEHREITVPLARGVLANLEEPGT